MPRHKPHSEETKLKISKGLTRHGMRGTRFYKIWESMKYRCNNKKFPTYWNKGISFCKRWESFYNFRDDMLKSYVEHSDKYGEKDTTIDRTNNNKGYSPNNCRWATRKVQCRNWEHTVRVIYKGEKMNLIEWCERLGLKYNLMRKRIIQCGWSVKRAFEQPAQVRRNLAQEMIKKLIK